MRHPMTVLAAIFLAATVVPAAADHDVPLDASLVKVDLVRAYAPCTAPNDVHDQIVVFANACSPAAPLSPYRFGPAGRGRVQVQRRSRWSTCSTTPAIASRPPAFACRSARQAVALGRDDTSACQRARFFCSGLMRMPLTRPKSTATTAVMSATV